jgi:hypothetical protein
MRIESPLCLPPLAGDLSASIGAERAAYRLPSEPFTGLPLVPGK